MSVIFVLNFIVIVGILVSALLAVTFDDLLSSVISLCVTGTLVALEFIMLSAPDVAIAEAAVGAVLSTVIFIVGLRRVLPKEGEDQ